MLEYDKIDISEGTDTNKNILTSKKRYLCGYWYFINKNFNYQKYMCNGCHDISTKTIILYPETKLVKSLQDTERNDKGFGKMDKIKRFSKKDVDEIFEILSPHL